MPNRPWKLIINDTLERTKQFVRDVLPPADGDTTQFEACRTEILARLDLLPGPNAHVDAHGTGEGKATLFVGGGDPYALYPPLSRLVNDERGPLPTIDPPPAPDALFPPLGDVDAETTLMRKRNVARKEEAVDLEDKRVAESIRESDRQAHMRPRP